MQRCNSNNVEEKFKILFHYPFNIAPLHPANFHNHTDPENRLRKFGGAKVQFQQCGRKVSSYLSLPFQHCTFAPCKFSQSQGWIQNMTGTDRENQRLSTEWKFYFQPSPWPLPNNVAQIMRKWAIEIANIVWWGRGGATMNCSSISFTWQLTCLLTGQTNIFFFRTPIQVDLIWPCISF